MPTPLKPLKPLPIRHKVVQKWLEYYGIELTVKNFNTAEVYIRSIFYAVIREVLRALSPDTCTVTESHVVFALKDKPRLAPNILKLQRRVARGELQALRSGLGGKPHITPSMLAACIKALTSERRLRWSTDAKLMIRNVLEEGISEKLRVAALSTNVS